MNRPYGRWRAERAARRAFAPGPFIIREPTWEGTSGQDVRKAPLLGRGR
eukprot:CAMPEP_0181191118 /NCGR_PEP_ID=MMETSP1096-20121128/12562_1 /TAXON_ID=156174 ORGANISM="Chrysochromulina ericina, Strain CCMP281" /NCGR_SAMPLE_ID=MMETSP1096 /ASSEMBLY_ACC=CAM_ASM_000453 /LENGTH=48 /DNA_ID= /DNA_START= /DNA_END= /DNA_ORIENTATION=